MTDWWDDTIIASHRNKSKGGAPIHFVSHKLARRVTVSCTAAPHIEGHHLFPLMLDGMLAWVGRRVRRGVAPRQFDTHVESLPLARFVEYQLPERMRASRRMWVWMASRAVSVDGIEEPYWRAGSPDENFDVAATRSHRRINTTSGRDAAFWASSPITVTSELKWRCVGSPVLIERWLNHLAGVGGGVARGHGEVSRWTVHDEGPSTTPLDDLRWVLEYGRPVPALWGDQLGLNGRTLGAYRPPYISSARTGIGRRHDVEVAIP